MTCPICGSDVTAKNARGKLRVTCSEPCRAALIARRGGAEKATAARKRACVLRVNQRLDYYFGHLSAREVAIVRYVWRHAYQRAISRRWNIENSRKDLNR
jgi:hypothetical protein